MKTQLIYITLMATSAIAVAQPGVGPVTSSTSSTTVASYAGGTYLIKSRSKQRCLDFVSQNEQPGATVRLNVPDWTTGQKFTFENAGDSYYYIRIRSNNARFYLTLTYQGLVAGQQGGTAAGSYQLKQEELYASNPIDAHAAWSKTGSQKWKIRPASDNTCVLISNKNQPTKVLTVNSANTIGYTLNTGSNNEQWIIKPASLKENPKSADAEIGIIPNCAGEVYWNIFRVTFPKDLSLTLPEWRAVGDNNTPVGPDYHPRFSYETLEGVVKSAHVADVDAPNTHYTHDFDFDVYPDPPFRYLTANRGGLSQRNVGVEWETGIGQSADSHNNQINPADIPNRRGDSYGFFTVGHRRQQRIWNWPTINDWVHVEGPWIWDRGHPPAKTEIHPPRFVAIQRNLPDKYTQPGGVNYFYATRCDIFASGDGGAMMNNRGLKPYVEKVNMSQRNYTVIFKHPIPRPNSNSQLTFSFQRQDGDNFPVNAQVERFSNGSADVPEPHVRVTIPWSTSHVSDISVFARTLFIYWDDAPAHGKAFSYAIKTLRVSIDSIYVLSKEEGDDSDPGEFRMFADIGGKWFFLNEYIGVDDILSKGLGAVKPVFIGFPGQLLPDKFRINQSVEIYLPEGKTFRCFTRGWEDDYIGYHFGQLFSPYSSCSEAQNFLIQNFDGDDGVRQGRDDDPLGVVESTNRFLDQYPKVISVPSVGVTNPDGGLGPNNIYKPVFRIRLF